MPSALHRGLVELFRRDPALIFELTLRELGRALPDALRFEARDGRLVATSFVLDPREIAVDLLALGLELRRDAEGNDEYVAHIVGTFETQLRMDPEKLFRWLEYIAAARRDHRCRGLQSVFSPDPEVLAQIRQAFDEEAHFCPVLLGPACIPKLVDVEAIVARPVLGTLSAIVHAHAPEGPAIIEAVVESFRQRPDATWHDDARILWSCISEDIMNKLSTPIQLDRFESDVWDDDDDGEPSNWEKGTGLWQRALRAGREEGREEGREQGREEGREEGREQGREEGLLHGLRQALLLVSAAQGHALTPTQREAISLASREQLEAWLRDGL